MTAISAYIGMVASLVAIAGLLVAAKRDGIWPGVLAPILWLANTFGFCVARTLRADFGWSEITTSFLNNWALMIQLLGELLLLGAALIVIATVKKPHG